MEKITRTCSEESGQIIQRNYYFCVREFKSAFALATADNDLLRTGFGG